MFYHQFVFIKENRRLRYDMINKINILIILAVLLVPVSSFAVSDAWKDQILYFVLIDRFFDGNPANNSRVDPNDIEAFQGGDISGISKKLGYLEDLGVTGIWLSPFITNRDRNFFGQEPYHGYWPYDFFSVDKRFGTNAELESLRRGLRSKRFTLLLDMVVNHMGYDAPFTQLHPDWFNPEVNIEDWNDPEQLVNRRIYGLPDFNSGKLIVKAYFRQVARHWIRALNPDGFRLDAVKHVPAEFWVNFNDSARKNSHKRNFLLLGEYLNGNPEDLLKTWQEGKFDSLFDFPLYYTMKEVFADGKSPYKLASRLYFDRRYPDAGFLATFLDNHDLDRFITSCKADIRSYKLAMTFLMTVRGIPVLCYGNEVPLEGEHAEKPMNRGNMVFNQKSHMYLFTKDLIKFRKDNEALRRGLHCHLYADENSYLYGRLTSNQLVLVALNNSEQALKINAEFPFELENNDVLLTSVKGFNTSAVINEKRINISLPPKSFAIFVPNCDPGYYKDAYERAKKHFENEYEQGTVNQKIRVKVANYLPDQAKVFITGNCKELGSWNNANCAVQMVKVKKNLYETTITMPKGKIFECKPFYKNGSQTVWKEGENTIHLAGEKGGEFLHIDWAN
jgi:glycosidase